MKALIVDDSRLARNELRHLLKDFDQVDVVGEAANAEEAKKLTENLKPEVIFLDIQMPGKDGFVLLNELEYVPEVIFTTAFNEYALKAFEFNALDYLLKPVQKQRLQEAVNKVSEKIHKAQEMEPHSHKLRESDNVFVKDGEKCWFVKLSEIKLFEVYGSYTRVYFSHYTPLINRTLNYLEERLDEKVFFRANRQQIINLRCIDRIEPWFSGSLKVFMKEGGEVEISRRQTVKFKELLSL